MSGPAPLRPRADLRARRRLPRAGAGARGQDAPEGLRGCRELYESELRLNASLGSLDFEEPRSVCRGVAMALPTRSLRARLLWAGLAVVLLLTTSVTLRLDGTNPAALALEAVSVFWGFVAGLADVAQVVFVAVGPALLVALAVGALVDLVIVAVYLSVSRRRAREA